ncbi:hypothetical protein GC175_06665 [bacterium]|nr:hypothetical protein [bacterium]
MLTSIKAQQRWQDIKSELDQLAQQGHDVAITLRVLQPVGGGNEAAGMDAAVAVDGRPSVRTFFNGDGATAALLTEVETLTLMALCVLIGNYMVDQINAAGSSRWQKANLCAVFDEVSTVTSGHFHVNEQSNRPFPTDYQAALLLNVVRKRVQRWKSAPIDAISAAIEIDGSFHLYLGDISQEGQPVEEATTYAD